MTRTAPLPIRRIAFYKHGVSMVQRAGIVSGDAFQLGFREDDMNDALKSLTVRDRSGGQVVCLDYEIPASARKDANALRLGAGTGMLDLMERLVGWRVRADLAGLGAPVEGRVAGLQYAKESRRLKGATLMLLDEQSGSMQAVPAAEVTRLAPLEGRIREDLARFLDAGKRSDGTQSITLRLTPGEHDLVVSYLVPAPAWRVSYRVVAEAGGTGAASGPSAQPPGDVDAGTLLLQGWGLVDNRFDEDLEGVEMSLVAGQPISFVYDLKTSRVPARRRVEDESRVAAGPVEYRPEAARRAARQMFSLEPTSAAPERAPARTCEAEDGVDADAYAAYSDAGLQSMEMLVEAEPDRPTSATVDQGETFAYEVLQPVSIPRGSSALVPILQAKLEYRRELLFNESKHADHPVAALRCDNESGLVLERGPAILIEDGSYRGEAIVPFTGQGSALYLPYAVELGVRVRVETERSTRQGGIRLGDGLLYLELATDVSYRYAIVNRTGAARAITIERATDSLPGELMDTPAPVAAADGVYRWEVECADGEETSFTVRARQTQTRQYLLTRLHLRTIAGFLETKGLEAGTTRILETLREELARIEQNERLMGALEENLSDLNGRQEHLRSNIAALASTGDEGKVRLEMVRELQGAASAWSAARQRIDELKSENETLRRSLASKVPGAGAES